MAQLIPLAIMAVGSAVAGKLLSPKPKQMAAPVQRIDNSSSAVADALQNRRGTQSNQRTGGLGVEAGPSAGVKSKLGT